MRRTAAALTLIAAQTTAIAALATVPALAGGGNDARANGTCSAGTDWKLKAKADNGRIEVEAEVDSNQVGQTWSWKLKDNGTLAASGTSKTTGPSGSFSVHRKPANLPGTDHFVFRAVNPESGEVCRGTVSW
jgi:hypothetical protein